MASVMSTVLSRLNAFLDTELEQVICFDSAIDAETFASEKCAIFLILPEEDTTKHFLAGLMIQNLSRELFKIADDNGGRLPNRAVAVYMYLRDRSDGEGACWPSIGNIARELWLSRSTVQRALNDLYRAGFLEKQNRRQPNGSLTSNLFTIK